MKRLQSSRSACRRRNKSHRLRFEPLEARRVLATITVTNTDDSGAGSLRAAIEQANSSAGSDTICFSSDLNGDDINLTTGGLNITDNLIIDADSLSNGITIDASASNGSRVFSVDNNSAATEIEVEMHNLTISGGNFDGNGGAIWNAENLELYD